MEGPQSSYGGLPAVHANRHRERVSVLSPQPSRSSKRHRQHHGRAAAAVTFGFVDRSDDGAYQDNLVVKPGFGPIREQPSVRRRGTLRRGRRRLRGQSFRSRRPGDGDLEGGHYSRPEDGRLCRLQVRGDTRGPDRCGGRVNTGLLLAGNHPVQRVREHCGLQHHRWVQQSGQCLQLRCERTNTTAIRGRLHDKEGLRPKTDDVLPRPQRHDDRGLRGPDGTLAFSLEKRAVPLQRFSAFAGSARRAIEVDARLFN